MVKRTPEEREKLAEDVLKGMAERNLSCFKACEAAGVPIGSFLRWVEQDAQLAERYARTRETLIERIAEETMEIADQEAEDAVQVNKQRLQVDTRKWLLAKLAPQRYGDKLHLAGHDGGTVKTETETRVAPDALREITEALLQRAVAKGDGK